MKREVDNLLMDFIADYGVYEFKDNMLRVEITNTQGDII
jgi:hypothetical protein